MRLTTYVLQVVTVNPSKKLIQIASPITKLPNPTNQLPMQTFTRIY